MDKGLRFVYAGRYYAWMPGKKLENLDGGSIQLERVESNEGVRNRPVLESVPAKTAIDHPSSKESKHPRLVSVTRWRTREPCVELRVEIRVIPGHVAYWSGNRPGPFERTLSDLIDKSRLVLVR